LSLPALLIALVIFAGPAAGAETLRLGYTNAQGAKIPVFVGRDRGVFEKYGLELRLLRVSPGRLAVPQLLSGAIEFFLGNSGPVVEAIALESAPLAIIASLGKEQFAVYAGPAIRRVDDLKGKKFGVSTPGASQDRIAARALKRMGLEPERDIRIVATGFNNSVDRLRALARGEVDAVAATADDLLQLSAEESAGVRKLIDLAEVGILVSGADITVARGTIEARRATVEKFLQAVDESVRLAKDRPDLVAAAYKKYAGVEDPKALEKKVEEYYAGKPPARPLPDRAAIQSAIDELKERSPALKAADAAAYIDDTLGQAR